MTRESQEVRLTPLPAVMRATVNSPTVTLRTNLWLNWARIAVDQERSSKTALEDLKRAWKEPGASRDILREMHPALIAVVACAHALDALHADVAEVMGREGDARRHKGKRQRQWEYMLDTFKLEIPEAESWKSDFDSLFSSRDNAVHFKGASQAPAPHPELPTNVSPVNVEFCSKSASRAVDLLLRVFRAIMIDSGASTEVAKWGSDRRHVLVDLERAREIG